MKIARFNELQILSILRRAEGGVAVPEEPLYLYQPTRKAILNLNDEQLASEPS